MCYNSLPSSPLFKLLRHGSLWLGHGVRCSPLPSEQQFQTEGPCEWIWHVWPGIVSAQLSSVQNTCWFMIILPNISGIINNPRGGSLLILLTNQYNGITGGFEHCSIEGGPGIWWTRVWTKDDIRSSGPKLCSEAFIILPQIDGTTMDEQTHTHKNLYNISTISVYISLWYYLGMDIFYQKMQGWSALPRLNLSSPAFTVCEMPGSSGPCRKQGGPENPKARRHTARLFLKILWCGQLRSARNRRKIFT